MSISELRKRLDSAGKFEQLTILNDIMKLCYQNRDKEIFTYFDQYLALLKEYLAFDDKPNRMIRDNITEVFGIAFDFIRNSNDFPGFNKYYPFYAQVKEFLTDAVSLAKLFQIFGYFHWVRQDMQKSMEYLSRSLELITESGNIDEIPGRYTNLGYLFEFRGDFAKAEYYYREGMNFARKHNLLEAMKLAYAAIGRLYMALCDYEKAERYLKDAISLFDNDSQPPAKIAIICNLALVYYQTKEFKEALNIYTGLKTDQLKQADPKLYHSVLEYMALCHNELGDFDKAREYLTAVLDFAHIVGAKDHIVNSSFLLGSNYERAGKLDKALEHYRDASRLVTESNRYHQLIYWNMGNVLRKKRDYIPAIDHYIRAVEILKNQKLYEKAAVVSREISRCYEALKQPDKALKYLQEGWKWKEKNEKEVIKREREKRKETIVDTGNKRHLLFSDSDSLISRELTLKIGAPIIGRTPAIKTVVEQALLTAKNDNVNLLLKGESGTGKELIARLIHYAGNRANYPFVDVNSASFSSGLADSTLFGHEKGAFTGATSKHYGYIQAANNGTLFLDEVGDMPLDIQSKLLRVLETKSFKPVGSDKKVKVDFRLICATNHDLQQAVKKNKFRLDLYNRINTIELVIPPLRERREDIPLIMNYYIDSIAQRSGIKRPQLSSEVIDRIYHFDFPGNVRELLNILERLVLFSGKAVIGIDDLILDDNSKLPDVKRPACESLNLADNEKALIKEALKRTDNVKKEAANLLGITTYSLLRRLKKMENGE